MNRPGALLLLLASACLPPTPPPPGGDLGVQAPPADGPPRPGSLPVGARCTAHAPCESGVCAMPESGQDRWTLTARTCWPADRVLFVAPRGACHDAPEAGAREMPLCELARAMQRTGAQGRDILRLAPGTYEETWAQGRGRFAVYGPDPEEGTATLLAPRGAMQAVQIDSDLAEAAELMLYRVTLKTSGEARGVSCARSGVLSPVPALYLLHSVVAQAPLTGLDIQGCRLHLLHTDLIGNRGGALVLRGGARYEISDTRFLGNSAPAQAAILLSNDSQGTWRGVEISNNHAARPGVPGGIDCGTGDRVELGDVLLCQNSQGQDRDGKPVQHSGACDLRARRSCP